jgi:hypothetical protein
MDCIAHVGTIHNATSRPISIQLVIQLLIYEVELTAACSCSSAASKYSISDCGFEGFDLALALKSLLLGGMIVGALFRSKQLI